MNVKSLLQNSAVSNKVFTMINSFINKLVVIQRQLEHLEEVHMETKQLSKIILHQLIVRLNVKLNVLRQETTVIGTLMTLIIHHLSVSFTQVHALLDNLVPLLLQLIPIKRFRCVIGLNLL
jgi:triphosphoribosyl-dephospho-CoA synthetase